MNFETFELLSNSLPDKILGESYLKLFLVYSNELGNYF